MFFRRLLSMNSSDLVQNEQPDLTPQLRTITQLDMPSSESTCVRGVNRPAPVPLVIAHH